MLRCSQISPRYLDKPLCALPEIKNASTLILTKDLGKIRIRSNRGKYNASVVTYLMSQRTAFGDRLVTERCWQVPHGVKEVIRTLVGS